MVLKPRAALQRHHHYGTRLEIAVPHPQKLLGLALSFFNSQVYLFHPGRLLQLFCSWLMPIYSYTQLAVLCYPCLSVHASWRMEDDEAMDRLLEAILRGSKNHALPV